MSAQFIRKLSGKVPVHWVKLLANIWPPFLGAGIKVLKMSPDFRYMKVLLKRKWYNSNAVGTQFGGSIYAMIDPFYMIMIMNNIGNEFIVWDRAANIQFRKQGRSQLTAEFNLSQQQITEIKDQVRATGRENFDLKVDIKDEKDVTVATVIKTIYVRLKESAPI